MSRYEIAEYQKDLETTYRSCISVKALRGKSVILTGATGLIGSYLVDFLIYCNEVQGFACEIYAAGRKRDGFDKRFAAHKGKAYLHYLPYDMAKPVRWELTADYVIHAAGLAYPKAFMADPVATVLAHVDGTAEILRWAACHEVKRFLFLSSGEVYGQPCEGMEAFTEEYSGAVDSLAPRSCYPISKRTAENLCAAYSGGQTMETVIARPCHTYGPSARNQDDRVASAFVRDVLAQQDIVMKSTGSQKRSWCYVADCASGIMTILLCGKGRHAYNVATPQSRLTIRQMAELIADLGGRSVVLQLAAGEEQADFNRMDHAVLSSYALEALGWQGKYDAKQGLLQMICVMKQMTAE